MQIAPVLFALSMATSVGWDMGGGWSAEGAAGPEMRLNGMLAREVFQEPKTASLAITACEGDVSLVKQEIANGANPNGKGYQGVTPLFWAVACQSRKGMEALLNAGADPNQRLSDDAGNTPMIGAAWADDPEVLKILLKHGGDPNAAYAGTGPSVLMGAFDCGVLTARWDNYYTLLNRGADINREFGGRTIVDWAAMHNDYDKIAELLNRGYNHNLERLGLHVQRDDYPKMLPSVRAGRAKVKSMLEARGVHFPIPDPDHDRGFIPPLKK
jgi:ankyrin repeat protein